MKVVGFLQNAWSPLYAGGTWPRESWLRALYACHSGKKLAKIERACEGVTFHWDNTTPIVGATADSVVPPDKAHVAKVLLEHNPDLVIAFGAQALRTLLSKYEWCEYNLVGVPHPAYRFLSEQPYELLALLIKGVQGDIKNGIERDDPLRSQIIQGKGYTETLPLE